MSREIFVISDTHFGHANIIRYCNRPFHSTEEMDDVMIKNWNSVVGDEDIVYHLGDVYMGKAPGFLRNLRGRKRLILGNHDNGKDQLLQNVFQKVLMWRMFREFGLLLTHAPVHPSTLGEGVTNSGEKKEPLVNIHGHIHQNKSPPGPYRNVSVEAINYTPINIEELRVR